MKKTLALLLSAAISLSCGIPVLAAPAGQQAAETAQPELLLAGVSGAYNLTALEDSEAFLAITTIGGDDTSVNDGDDTDPDSSTGEPEGEEPTDPTNGNGEGEEGSSTGEGEGESGSDTTTSQPEVTNPRAPAAAPAKVQSSSTKPASSTSPSSTQKPAAAKTNTNTASSSTPKTYKGVEGYVERMYDFVLNRAAKKGEVDQYVKDLKAGTTAAGPLAYNFFNSDEFKNRNLSDKEYVTVLYRALFNRTAKDSEVSHYVSALKYDSRNQVLTYFVGSDEFRRLCEGFGVEAGTITLSDYKDLHGGTARFVERLYKQVLNRNPKDREIEERTRELVDGGSNAAQMGYEFLNSPEFIGRNLSDLEYVQVLYKTMLDRNAKTNEPAYYTKMLEEGVSRNYVYGCFINSPEFFRLCEAYGVPTGGLYTTDPYDTHPDASRFATRQYKYVLGRTRVKEQEIRERVGQLVNGEGAAQLTIDCFLSPEFKNRNLNDSEYITTLYNAVLGRSPKASEVEYYLNMLEEGASKNYILSSFLSSPEFKQLCDSYNVKLGTIILPDVVGPNSKTNNFEGAENGIDVSMHQGSINWSAVKAAGYDFAIIRATTYTGGLQVDPYFYENVRGAKKAGLKVGTYVYTYSYSTSGVNNELNTLYSALSNIEKEGYRLDYPVFWDVEANNYTNQASKDDLTTLAKYAIDSMRSKGYYGALYTYTNFANTRLDMSRLSGYDMWIAQYGPRVTYSGSYTMWQYTSSGSVSGVSGNVDLNYSYKDYESEIKNGGWNHW